MHQAGTRVQLEHQIAAAIHEWFSGRSYALALGGAQSKGLSDDLSDVDFYGFADDWPDDGQRTLLAHAALPAATGVRSWSQVPTQAGTDFEFEGRSVEIWLRNLSLLVLQVERALSGKIERHYCTWAPNGFWDHCALADLHSLRIIEDEAGRLADVQDRLRQYPHALKMSLCQVGFASVNFWRGSFHLQTAIERCDEFYLQSILHQIRSELVQALFAINEVYYPGDKKLERWFERLPSLPRDFRARWIKTAALGQATSSEWRSRFDGLFTLADELLRLQEL